MLSCVTASTFESYLFLILHDSSGPILTQRISTMPAGGRMLTFQFGSSGFAHANFFLRECHYHLFPVQVPTLLRHYSSPGSGFFLDCSTAVSIEVRFIGHCRHRLVFSRKKLHYATTCRLRHSKPLVIFCKI